MYVLINEDGHNGVRVVRQGCNLVQHLDQTFVPRYLVRSQQLGLQPGFGTGSRTMSRGALKLGICAPLSASRPTSVTIQRKPRFILTSTAATLPMMLMSTSMVGCPLKYGNLQGISTTQSPVQFCD